MKRLAPALAGIALLGAAAPTPREMAPGEGVLCNAVFIYAARQEGAHCFADDDPEFQAKLREWTRRYDEYLIRNMPNGADDLELFKQDEGVSAQPNPGICEFAGERSIYETYRDANREQLSKFIDEALARDGPPTFGDCV